MSGGSIMKTAIWLYLFMFVAFFDLHAQYPILSPFALSLGAAPSFIGLILGMYSITHIPGNIIAGYAVDRYGSKRFIVLCLIAAGIILVFQSHVTNPWQLLIIRSISGFVLAFLSPACLAWLAKLARDRIHQGKLMAGNGLIHTLASVVSPAAGAFLVAQLGFSKSFTLLGWGLIGTGLFATVGIRETGLHRNDDLPMSRKNTESTPSSAYFSIPWLFFGIPLAISCSQGILFFELPLMKSTQSSIMTSGLLFSLVSLGALLTLSMLFLNRYPAFLRIVWGSLALALIFFGMAVHWLIPLSISLVLIGMSKGIIFPAIATLLAGITSSGRYGRMFALLSISYSIGAFIGPVAAGQLRDGISPFFLAFCALMLGLIALPFNKYNTLVSI
jgi:MFS family permease